MQERGRAPSSFRFGFRGSLCERCLRNDEKPDSAALFILNLLFVLVLVAVICIPTLFRTTYSIVLIPGDTQTLSAVPLYASLTSMSLTKAIKIVDLSKEIIMYQVEKKPALVSKPKESFNYVHARGVPRALARLLV